MTEPSQAPVRRRLARSSDNRWVGGVCAGLADHLGIDPVVPRVLFVVALFFNAPLVLAVYGVLWVLVPGDDARYGRHGTLFGVLLGIAIFVAVPALFVVIVTRSFGGAELLIFAGAIVAILALARRNPREFGYAAAAPATIEAPAEGVGGVEPRVPAWWHAPPPHRRRRLRSPLARATTGAALVVAGAALFAGVPLRTAVALVLGAVGAGMVVGAFRGQARPLIPVAVLLAGVLALTHLATVPEATARRGAYLRPAGELTADASYEAFNGAVTVDLRELTAATAESYTTYQVGIGHVVVIMPSDVQVWVRGSVGVGTLVDDGDARHGVHLATFATTERDSSQVPVTVEVKVGVGILEVRRG